MRNLRYVIRLIIAFLSRFKAIIAIGIGLGILIFLLINLIVPRLGTAHTTRIGLSGRYNLNTLPNSILDMIGDGLTKLEADGSVSPNLAVSWDTPDKGKTWIFKIKKGIKWQDGRELTSKSMEYRFSDAVITYPDNETVVFSLQDPYSAFPVVVTRPVFRGGLMGTGEWKVTNLKLVSDFVDQITLINQQKQKIIYKFYPTEERTKIAFELGEVDKVSELLDPNPINNWNNIKVKKEANRGEYVAVFFNTSDNLLGDKTVRQTLSYATNKSNLPGERAISPVSVASWAYNPQVKQYLYDEAKAKTMFKGLSAEVKNNPNITLTTSPFLLPQAEAIQKNWEATGFKVKIEVMSNIPSNYQALLAIFDIPEDPDQYTIWHSTQTQTNVTHYSNPRIDKLLEDGRANINPSERKQIYLDFQRFLVEDSPAIFLYYPSVYTLER